MFTPPMEISPSVTSQNRAISLATVDLPPPDGPTSAVKLPCERCRLMPWSTSPDFSPVYEKRTFFSATWIPILRQ